MSTKKGKSKQRDLHGQGERREPADLPRQAPNPGSGQVPDRNPDRVGRLAHKK
jgi:hypothetical protein